MIRKYKPMIIYAIPAVIFFYLGNKIGFAWRISSGADASQKFFSFFGNLGSAFENIALSFNPSDLLVSLITAAAAVALMYYKKKNAKKFRQGEEHGSARWGTPKDIAPFENKNFERNIILSNTEFLSMDKASSFKFERNKNILITGGSGSGKTFGYVKPNLMQMHSSYVVTDPKGTILVDCGKMLQRGRDTGLKDKDGKIIYEQYKIKVLNTVDFNKSMHYNPFAYIFEETCEQDILKFVEVLIKNTSGSGSQKDEDFWVKAEKLLYTAYIAMIFCVSPKEERNMETLIEMINCSECSEEDESFQNAIDLQFEAVEKWINSRIKEDDEMEGFEDMKEIDPTKQQIKIGNFACRQYKAYKLAAGKTAKSILVSCSSRLGYFSIDEVLELTSYDELEIDKLGDELSALFVIISDTDSTFNFLVAIMYSQMFNLLCTKADNNPDGSGKLKYHVRCILDEFANIGEIPNFDKLIATIRSREISASIILQTKSQLKAIYKDNADTIEGNCDTTIFLGGKEKSTLKDISETLGKETINDFNTSDTRGNNRSFGLNYSKLGRELMSQDEVSVMDGGKCIVHVRGVRPFFSDKFNTKKHKNYKLLFDYRKKNRFDIEKFVREKKEHKLKLNKRSKIDMYQDMSFFNN